MSLLAEYGITPKARLTPKGLKPSAIWYCDEYGFCSYADDSGGGTDNSGICETLGLNLYNWIQTVNSFQQAVDKYLMLFNDCTYLPEPVIGSPIPCGDYALKLEAAIIGLNNAQARMYSTPDAITYYHCMGGGY